MAEFTATEIRAETIREVRAMDETVDSLLGMAEDMTDDADLVRHLTTLQHALDAFLTYVR